MTTLHRHRLRSQCVDLRRRLARRSLRAQGRTEVTVNDTGIQAENLTSSQDGSGLLRQHGERHDLPRRAGRRAGRTLDSGLDRRPDQRARRARGRQDQHAVGLPELHGRPRRRARGRTDRTAILRPEDRRGQGHLSVPQQWRRVQRHGDRGRRHGLRHRIVRQPHPPTAAGRHRARRVGQRISGLPPSTVLRSSPTVRCT